MDRKLKTIAYNVLIGLMVLAILGVCDYFGLSLRAWTQKMVEAGEVSVQVLQSYLAITLVMGFLLCMSLIVLAKKKSVKSFGSLALMLWFGTITKMMVPQTQVLLITMWIVGSMIGFALGYRDAFEDMKSSFMVWSTCVFVVDIMVLTNFFGVAGQSPYFTAVTANIFEVIIANVFALMFAYNWMVAQDKEKTVLNAIESASDLLLSLIGLISLGNGEVVEK